MGQPSVLCSSKKHEEEANQPGASSGVKTLANTSINTERGHSARAEIQGSANRSQ